MTSHQNAYQALRSQVIATSTRDYKARGILAVRCERCQLKDTHCICAFRQASNSNAEFVLILHRDEMFKPTNTGRLIADCFPMQTHAFCWDRLNPAIALLDLIKDPKRHCMIIFPAEAQEDRKVLTQPNAEQKQLTLILLDGTWKQGRRMFNLSPWLQGIPVLRLNPAEKALYSSRVAAFDNYLSTAESAALALGLAGEPANSKLLFNYFERFNLHYSAMRKNVIIDQQQPE